MKKVLANIFSLLLASVAFADINIPQPVSFTTIQIPTNLNVQQIDSEVLSKMAVKFNGQNNPEVVLVLDKGSVKYYDGNDKNKWTIMNDPSKWSQGLQYGGGGTTDIVSFLEVQFNKGSAPYIVVGEWSGVVNFYNGQTWQNISDPNYLYSDVSDMWVQFNGANYPNVVAGYGQGDGDINYYNGNSDFSWQQLNPSENYNTYTSGYNVKNLFVKPNPSGTPAILAIMVPLDVENPIYVSFYDPQKGQWNKIATSSYLDNYINQASAQFSDTEFYMALAIQPNNENTKPTSKIAFFNGTKWSFLLDTPTAMSGKFAIQFNGSSNPYVIATTADSRMEFFNGSTWKELPPPQLDIRKLYTKFNGTAAPDMVAADIHNNIKYFDGTKWIELHKANSQIKKNLVSGKSSIMRVSFNNNANPYIVLADVQSGNSFFYNGTAWKPLHKSEELTKEHQEVQVRQKEVYNAAVQQEEQGPGGDSGLEFPNWDGPNTDTSGN